MIATNSTNRESAHERIARLGEEMVELAFLLPDWQAAALEAAAHGCGMTAGQLMRRILQEYFAKFAQPNR
jgi:hypothetical protein